MTEATTVPVPAAVRELIISNNELLQKYQQELTARVQVANSEMMSMLGLNPEEGWKLDVEKMMYVKQETTTEG